MGDRADRIVTDEEAPGAAKSSGHVRSGQAVHLKYGRAHYQAIGRQGGQAIHMRRGREYFAAIGRKGGQKTAERGQEYYRAIGRKGGQAGAGRTRRRRDTPALAASA